MEMDRGPSRRGRAPLSAIALAVAAVAAVVLARGTIVALCGAIGLVLATGVAAVLVAFPPEGPDGPTGLERVALSVVLGPVLAALVALALAAAGVLGPVTFGGGLLALVVTGAGVALGRLVSSSTPADGRFTGLTFPGGGTRTATTAPRGIVDALGRWPAIGLALLGGAAIVWLVALALGAGAAPLTEFSLRTATDAGTVADAPNALAPGERATVSLRVGNHAAAERTFTVVVLLWNATRSEPTEVAAERELDRFRIAAPPGGTERRRYTLAPPRGEYRVVYLLFEGTAPAEPSAGGAEPVARLHHWLSVGNASSAGNASLAEPPGPPPWSRAPLPGSTASTGSRSGVSTRRVTARGDTRGGSDGG